LVSYSGVKEVTYISLYVLSARYEEVWSSYSSCWSLSAACWTSRIGFCSSRWLTHAPLFP